MNTPTLYGPIGKAVREVSPYSETDPVGIYAAALTMWSAAIAGTVHVSSRGKARPVLLWSALVAGTGRGKGNALRAAEHVMSEPLGRFLDTFTTSGFTSGAAIISHLSEQAEATSESEGGTDTRCLSISEEWSEDLFQAKKDKKFGTTIRKAWDGGPLRNSTVKEPKAVESPRLVLHCHITPAEFSRFALGGSEAQGGSLNRIMPFTLRAVPMLDDEHGLPSVDTEALKDAYAWARAKERAISLAEDAMPLWRLVRRYGRILGETLPETQAVMIERTAEQTLRVAAVLAASEKSTTITRDVLKAAFSLVRYSVKCATSLVAAQASIPKVGRTVLNSPSRVLAYVSANPGCTSTSLLRGAKVTKADVQELVSTGALVMVKGPASGGRRPETYWLAGQAGADERRASTPEPRGDHSGFSRPSTLRSQTTVQLESVTKAQRPSDRPRLRLVTAETRQAQSEPQTAVQASQNPTSAPAVASGSETLGDLLSQW
ncbi:DUF3987 domain-containing protein [Streptomyces albus]|uniref:DUF3987 domain-containing protein n=1 Tax=Streptomyces sp. NRRL F-5917 TaxID=1463873 RepID=UPI00068999FA|nr:DUF3987 domain-containing protein [Streptomyces sp. NRRL F-5917]